MSKQKIGEASLILAAGSITGNLLQIGKLVLVTAWFGASNGSLDEYNVALNIPLALHGVILGALQCSFIPVYTGHLARGETDSAKRVLSATFSFGLLLYGLIAVLLGIFAEPVVRVFTSNSDALSFALTVRLFRLLLTLFVLSGICELLSAFYTGNQRYFLPAMLPALSILVSIGYLVVAFHSQGVYALAYGLIWGSVLQAVLLLVGSAKWGDFTVGLTHKLFTMDVRPVYLAIPPMAAALLLSHANLLIDVAVANRLATGSVTILNNATRMHDVVLKLFVISISNALLPFLAQYAAQGRFGEFRSTLALGNRIAFLALVPAAILIACFGQEIISLLFQRGRFTAYDSHAVGVTWAAYSAGLYFTAMAIFGQRGLMARRAMHPLWMAVACGLPINIFLDIVLSRYMGVAGIALGTGLVYGFYAAFYEFYLRKAFAETGAEKPSLSPFWRSVAAVTIMAMVAVFARVLLRQFVDFNPEKSAVLWLRNGISLMAGIGVSILSWGAAIKIFRISEGDRLLDFVLGLVTKLKLRRPNS